MIYPTLAGNQFDFANNSLNKAMKKTILTIVPCAAAVALMAGCSTHDRGPYLAQTPKTPAYESTEPVVLLDPGVQHSVTYTAVNASTLEDGRLEAIVQLRNRENRRIEVQANCVFKDVNGVSTGDETPFQTVILTENATEHVKFTSMNDKAKRYTIRVRQAR
jgi:uncharacterized protein YcfL